MSNKLEKVLAEFKDHLKETGKALQEQTRQTPDETKEPKNLNSVQSKDKEIQK